MSCIHVSARTTDRSKKFIVHVAQPSPPYASQHRSPRMNQLPRIRESSSLSQASNRMNEIESTIRFELNLSRLLSKKRKYVHPPSRSGDKPRKTSQTGGRTRVSSKMWLSAKLGRYELVGVRRSCLMTSLIFSEKRNTCPLVTRVAARSSVHVRNLYLLFFPESPALSLAMTSALPRGFYYNNKVTSYRNFFET